MLFNTADLESTIKPNTIAYHFIQEVFHVMSGGQCMSTQMRTWLICLLSHSVVQSKPSLFVQYYSKYFLRKKSRGYGRRVSRSCDPQELELPSLFMKILHTRCAFMTQVGVAGFCRTRYFCFDFFFLIVVILQFNAVYPE